MRMLSERTQRLLPILLLLLAAFIYYSLYYRSGFEIADEGSVALLSQRLLEGERPFIDVSLHYNLLWFYPITGLFALTGPDFVVMRIYFFALAAVTAVIGYFTVLRISGSRWYSLAAGLLLVLLPGSPYKTYIPLIIVANLYLMVRLVTEKRDLRMYALTAALGGMVLGLAHLVRIDVAMLLSVVWAGLFAMEALLRWREFRLAWMRACVGLAAFMLTASLVHLPAYAVAVNQGFERPFVRQYTQTRGMLSGPIYRIISGRPARDQNEQPTPAAEKKRQVRVHQTLARPSPGVTFHGEDFKERVFGFLTYAPVAGVMLLLFVVFVPPRRWHFPVRIQLAAALGAAPLAAFPQFFLFRPDMPHLSEFMPGYITAIAAGAYLLTTAGMRWFRWLAALFTALHLSVYAAFAFQEPFSGTVIARKKRTQLFEAENGVSVYLTKKEARAFSKLVQVIHDYSRAGEYVVCYPYFPGINFMANRPTYEKSIYIDNLMRPAGWYEETVREIEEYQPAVFVLRDWEIQGPGSAFSVWAADVREYIESNYHHEGTYWHFEVYTRRSEPVREKESREEREAALSSTSS